MLWDGTAPLEPRILNLVYGKLCSMTNLQSSTVRFSGTGISKEYDIESPVLEIANKIGNYGGLVIGLSQDRNA